MKQAVILAAGIGRRLNGSANGRPKCLVRVGDCTLIERQIQILHRVGVTRIAVVVGHDAQAIRSTLGSRCDYVVNEQFADTNSLYSLWLARHWVSGSFLLLNCDILAHPDVYHRVMAINGSALAYDSTSGHEDEHMKVELAGGLVRGLSKQMSADDVCGENVGILQFERAAAENLFRQADEIVGGGTLGDWAPAAVSRLAKSHPIRAVDIAGLPWTEIDFPEDLRAADREVLPIIERGEWLVRGGMPRAGDPQSRQEFADRPARHGGGLRERAEDHAR